MRPYFLQPYKLLPYISSKKQVWPVEITREYYTSFEDALWDLLPRLGYQKGSKFLVPSFYCVDVIENMREHGYEVAIYEIEKDLSVDPERVMEAINKENPDIFVNFDAVGKPTGLSEWLQKQLSFQKLIIEDRVHSLVGSTIRNYPISDRHLILTSSRKVTPFQGSLALYTRNARKSQYKLPIGYTIKAFSLWAYYIVILNIAVFLRSKRIAIFAAKLLIKHNNLIGDEKRSSQLPKLFLNLMDSIPVTTIEKVKKKQFSMYHKLMKPLFNSSVWGMKNAKKFAGLLRAYPIIIKAEYAESFKNTCHTLGFLTVSELDDCSWARDQKVFYLPLGPHLQDKDILNIAKITQKALTATIQYDTITA